jgi:UDP:flavonoid glycosyltransferase YjiC (YdhE family)
VALSGDATVEAIRAAAQDVLSTPSYRDKAQQRCARLTGIDGAANAANEVESLLAGGRAEPSAHRGQCQQVA